MFSIKGSVETNLSADEWFDQFIIWIESRGEFFGGILKKEDMVIVSCLEKEFNLPEGTIRRDIHRGRFNEKEYMKNGRFWFASREAVERIYKKNSHD